MHKVVEIGLPKPTIGQDSMQARQPFSVAKTCRFQYEIHSYVKMRDAKPRPSAGSGACLSFHLGYEKKGVDLIYDIAVVGAGPAGATFARLVADRYKVLVVDKRLFPDTSKSFAAGKCCGGLLAPDAQRMLSRLGLGLPKEVLEEPQLFVVRAIDIPQRTERYYQRHYINIHRQKFDRWLLHLVQPNVDMRLGWRLRTCAAEDDGVRLVFSQGANTCTEKARILVGADGASSSVRKLLAPAAAQPRTYIAIQEWVETESPMPYFSSLFDPQLTDFYCWTIPKDRHLIVGAALDPRDNTSEKFNRLKSTLCDFGFRMGKTVFREGAFLLRPMRTGQVTTGGAGVALIGEAAGLISPSSAEGLSYAFSSAMLLATAVSDSLHGFEKRYGEATARLRRNIFLKNLKSHFIFNPSLRKLVMRSGLSALDLHLP
jgi:geranylgeranyl reductase